MFLNKTNLLKLVGIFLGVFVGQIIYYIVCDIVRGEFDEILFGKSSTFQEDAQVGSSDLP